MPRPLLCVKCANLHAHTHSQTDMYRYTFKDAIHNRRKFRSQNSDNMDTWRKQKWEGSEKRKKKEDQGTRKNGNVPKLSVFLIFLGSGESKSRLAKAAGAEPSGQMREEKFHAVVARSRFEIKTLNAVRVRGHFWQLRCRKGARRCGAKHISKSEC